MVEDNSQMQAEMDGDMDPMEGYGDEDMDPMDYADEDMDGMDEMDDMDGEEDEMGNDSLDFENNPEFAGLPPLDRLRKIRRDIL